MITINTVLPSATVYLNNEKTPCESNTLFNHGLVVVFGLPAAFSPTCTESHLPGFVRETANITAKGVKTMACVSVNDRFVMNAWGNQLGAIEAGISMIADVNADFTRAIGAELDLTAAGLGLRSTRYAMIAQDGVIKHIAVDEPGKLEGASAEAILKILGTL